jgi:CelD/BcsL family acetyltransferase involved in cellulose biosynthesis
MNVSKSINDSINDSGRPVPPFTARLLEGPQDPLFAAAGSGRNVFISRAFLAGIERHILGPGERLMPIGVFDGAGQPVALFPFVRRRHLGLPIIEAVDFGIVDYFAPACLGAGELTTEETAQVWRAAVKAVPGVHDVAFKKMPRRMHGRAHALTHAGFVKPMGTHATTIFLRDTDGRSTGTMDLASIARKLKKTAKVLQKLGPLTFEEARDSMDVDDWLDKLVCFRTARFEQLARYDALLDPHVVAFYRDLAHENGAHENSEDPVARVFALRCGEEIVAVTYGFAFSGIFTLIAPTITPKPAFQTGSPGLVAMFKTLEWCQKKEFDVFDLSVGSLSYKSRFDADSIELFECQQALTPLGLPVVLEGWLRRRVRHLAVTYPGLRTSLERLRRRHDVKTRKSSSDE